MLRNPCCCGCVVVLNETFDRPNSADIDAGSPGGWDVNAGTVSILSNKLNVMTDNSRITSMITLPENFSVAVSFSNASTRDEIILYLDDRRIVMSPGATTHEFNRVTYDDDDGNVVTAVSTAMVAGFSDAPTGLRAVVVDGFLYVQTIGSLSTRNCIKQPIGTVNEVGLGVGNLAGAGLQLDNFIVKSAGSGSGCDPYANSNWCVIFGDSFTGENGGTVLGAHWRDQAGTLTFTSFFGTHYLTLTDGTIRSQPIFYESTAPEPDQLNIVFAVAPAAAAECSATLTLGGLTFTVWMNGNGCTCVTLDGTIARQLFNANGGMFLLQYDRTSQLLKLGNYLCKLPYALSLPEEVEITTTGSVRIDAITIVGARLGTGNPIDCSGVTALACTCYTISHIPCAGSITTMCGVQFTGSWSVEGGGSSTVLLTNGGSANLLPDETFVGYGVQRVGTGVKFTAEGNSLTLALGSCSVTVVCGSSPYGTGGLFGGKSVNIAPGSIYGVELQCTGGWCVARLFNHGGTFMRYAYWPAASVIDTHATISTSGEVRLITVSAGDDTTAYGTGFVETINEGTSECVASWLPTVCGVPKVTSILLEIAFSFPAGCGCTSGTAACEVLLDYLATGGYAFTGTVVICGYSCDVAITGGPAGVGACSIGYFAPSGDYLFLEFPAGACGTPLTATYAEISCDGGMTPLTGSGTLTATIPS